MSNVSFNRPYSTGREPELIADAMRRGQLSGDGHYTRRASEMLSDLLGSPKVLLTTSCTHALELAAMLLDIAPGDEVIMPSFTFVSTANAFALRGARPVFVDIERGTHNIDASLIEAAVTPRTKAIVVVHYAGVGCDMDLVCSIAERHGLAIVEDNAHGLGGSYRGRPLGSFGALSALSFHETKNIHCGEGGALIINDPNLVARAEVLREKGTNRTQFFRGQVDRYTWIDVGSSYLLSEVLAAFLAAQVACFEEIQHRRHTIWNHYAAHLHAWAEREGFEVPRPPDERAHPAHIYWLLAPDLATRTRFITWLADRGVAAVFHYVPLHSSPAGRRLAGEATLPITDDVSDRLVRLPLYPGLSDDELHVVVDAVTSFTSSTLPDSSASLRPSAVSAT